MTSRAQKRRAQRHRTRSPWYANTKPSMRGSIGCGGPTIAPFLVLAAVAVWRVTR